MLQPTLVGITLTLGLMTLQQQQELFRCRVMMANSDEQCWNDDACQTATSCIWPKIVSFREPLGWCQILDQEIM